MRKIISGDTYDTETSECLGNYEYHDDNQNLIYYQEALYVKSSGEFFLYVKGDIKSSCASVRHNSVLAGGENIIPLSDGEAQKWAMEHMTVKKYMDIFGRVFDDGGHKGCHVPSPAKEKEHTVPCGTLKIATGTGYKFTEEEMNAIEHARKAATNKSVETRLTALTMLAKGHLQKEVAEATGLHPTYIPQLLQKYRLCGLDAIAVDHHGQNRPRMSAETLEEILAPFAKRLENGETVEIGELLKAYRKRVGYYASVSHIYSVLHQHGWQMKPGK